MNEPTTDHSPLQAHVHQHEQGLARRLSLWRDAQLARLALRDAGDPGLVLDLPSGAGRFWPVLAEHANRVILAADPSWDMLDIAQAQSSTDVRQRIRTFQSSALCIDLSANAVDCIFCMRLFHHIADSDKRRAILDEFYRVTRDTAIVALWVDGNLKAWRRKRLERLSVREGEKSMPRNRFVVGRSQIESEFRDAGFRIVGHHDFLPGYAMWRVYVLRKVGS
ncbi:class I SAM-dependent methyltransferase [Pseudomonas sp. GD03842]|uniref:class I SAM-dependent methyltransferase n=1 Tax=unclassified Pseudomonas TaxID=196821 RepID=UPI000D33F147|nr:MULTISPECIES: class I SAM-dependent methyltransferase [unclassified Pseudomonas]MDH0747642.1 class I SAM-dependent methyltransferase [Pseudomonas sp. GD03842]RAU49323.1 class I SAM-dependent methyltransferase [Pseudomonas sp. RIT 409]RAU55936.1 class I SAM-dependent methyltransferase [Pseudomonas sp. RIT 412]